MPTPVPTTDYRYKNCGKCTAYCRNKPDGSIKIDHENDCPKLARDKEFSKFMQGFMQAREADYQAARDELIKAYPNATDDERREAWDRLRKAE